MENHNFTIDTAGAYKAQKCPTSTLPEYIVEHLVLVEEVYGCSGICEEESLFIFSNINNGAPKGSCIVMLREMMATDVADYFYGYLTVGLITLAG